MVSPPPPPPDPPPSRLRRSRGVGVARRARTFPAVGSISLPRRSTAPTLDESVDDDDINDAPDTSLPAALDSSSPHPPNSTLLLHDVAAALPSSP